MRLYKITVTQGKVPDSPFRIPQPDGQVTTMESRFPFNSRLTDDGKLLLRGVDIDYAFRAVKEYTVSVEDA
jgi:hypothetical protein